MFTPEFINDARREVVLVANHSLESDEAVQMSVKFNEARVKFGRHHLPAGDWTIRLIYDVRGQSIADVRLDQVSKTLSGLATVEFMR